MVASDHDSAAPGAIRNRAESVGHACSGPAVAIAGGRGSHTAPSVHPNSVALEIDGTPFTPPRLVSLAPDFLLLRNPRRDSGSKRIPAAGERYGRALPA